MSDEAETDEDSNTALSAIGDIAGDLITGIPAPIRKNALKAFARLCTATVEYPIALLENATAERRAESQARVRLIDASATQIAAQMQTNPEYIRAAARKFAQKIVRERVNIDQITDIAATQLQFDPPGLSPASPENDVLPISEDWLNAFENEAANLSSAQMQLLFGKILAGEIRRPSSFSIKTVRVMAQLDNRAAAIFRLFCSLSTSLYIQPLNHLMDARVISINAASNSLQAYGLTFDALNVLQEYGLIISDYNSWMDYRAAIVRDNRVSLPMKYQDSLWALVPRGEAPPLSSEFRVAGVAFSRSGKELLPVVETEANPQYTEYLKEFFDQQGMILTPISPPVG